MIVTVTPNPALDLTYTVPALEIGESQRVSTAAARAGGKGVNVARVIHQVGGAVTTIATVGGDTGRTFAADLGASGIPSRLIPVAAATRRSVALVDESRDETTVLNEVGGPFEAAEWAQVLTALSSLLVDTRCLVGSGSLPPGCPQALFAELARLAGDAGVPSVIDATGPALLLAAEAGASILKPNRRELAESTGEDDPVEGAARLLSRGARLVVVSLGRDGMIALAADHPGTVWGARLPRPLRGNPTGAGDAAVAAIATCLAERTADPDRIIRRATAWGAAAVLMPQAGELADNYPELEAGLVLSRD